MRKIILLVLVVAMAACGGSYGTSSGHEAAALESTASCSPDLLSWTTPTSSTAKCAGPWEYSQNCWLVAPNINCPGSSYPTGKACNHAHARRTDTVDVAIMPARKSVQECCYPNETNGFRCPKPPCVWRTAWDYQTPCTNAAIARRNSIPASNLDLRTPITYAARVTYAPGEGEAGTCQITLNNWPTSWHNKVDNALCATSTVTAADLERPILASCRLPDKTVCQPSADPYVQVCAQVPNQLVTGCSTAKQYSQPNLSLGDLRLAVGAGLIETSGQNPICLTDEDQPLTAEGKDPATLAKEKFDRLTTRLAAAGPDLRAKLIKNLKLLFELKGDSLTSEQRQAALDLHLSEPVVEPACGSTWDVPPDAANGPVGALKLSHRMTQDHVPAAVVNAVTSKYASVGHFVAEKAMADVAAWPPTHANRPAAQQQASEGPVRTLEKGLQVLMPADAASRKVILQKNLWVLGKWFDAARASSAYNPETYLSGLPYAEPVATYTRALKDRSVAGNPITLAGKQYPKGFGAHAASELVFDLTGKACTALDAVVGVDDEVGTSCPGSAAGFEVVADGVVLFSSGPVTKGQPLHVRVGIAGKKAVTLRATLADGQDWCDHADWAMARVTCDSQTDHRLWTDSSRLAGATWKSMYGPAHQAISPLTSPRAYKEAQLAVEREMVEALLADHQPVPATLGPAAPPLRKAPALFLLADALQALGDRLQPLASYHDLACRFLECSSVGTRSELSSLYRLIGAAALDQPSASQPSAPNLRDELTAADGGYNAEAANYKSALWSTYSALFARLRDRHSVVKDAVRDALGLAPADAYDGAKLVLAAPDSSVTPLVAFAGVVKEAGKKRENYLKTGLLLKETARALPVGLHAEKMAKIKSDTEARARALGDAIDVFQGKRAGYVSTLIEEIDHKTNTNDVEARKASLALRTYNLALDDAGLRISADVDRERLASHAKELGNALVGLLTQQGPVLGPFNVNGRDGRGPLSGTAFSRVTDVAILRFETGGLMASGVAGSVLSYSATGSYTPSCALKETSKFYGFPVNPAGGQASLGDAEASPSGYSFSFSEGSYKAYKQENTRSKSGQACGGLDITVPIPIPIPGLSAMFGASAKACASYSESRSWSKGNQSSSSASFAMGLRLPNTPFPDLPAGALLAVLVKPGSTLLTDVLDIQVMESQGSIAFARPADVYLVVNDIDCGDAPTVKELTVSMSRLVPATEMADKVGQAMKAVESYLWDVPVGGATSLGGSYVAQGRLLPGQMGDLRMDALQKLRTACGSVCDTSTLPAAILGFYDLWVGQQILRIEREIELLSIRRELDALVLEADAVDRDLAQLAAKGRLADILPRWSLGNLEFANGDLRQATDALVKVVAEELYPMVALRYPEALGNAAFRPLLGLDWVGEELGNVDTGVGLAGKVKKAVSDTATALDDVVRRSVADANDVTTAYAVVRFPNPEKPPVSSIYPGKAADTARSIPLWASIKRYFTPGCVRDPVTLQIVDPACQVRFDVRPDDLYGAGTTNGTLGCNLVAPVIKDMAFFLVTGAPDAGTRNAQNYLTPTRGERTMLFTLPGGIELWSFENEDYLLTPRTKLIYGKEQDWKTAFEAISPTELSESVRGTSPFTGYATDSAEAAGDHWWNYPGGTWGAYSVQDFVVVMRIEARKKAPGVRGVWSCP